MGYLIPPIKMFKKDKRGLEFEVLIKWIIALVVLVLVILGAVILSGKGTSLFENIKNLFIFKR